LADFILLMHDDGGDTDPAAWERYFRRLRAAGVFEGGSQIGDGGTYRKAGQPRSIAGWIGGYIRITAEDLETAQTWLDGNPVYEAGGTVEIRELPRS